MREIILMCISGAAGCLIGAIGLCCFCRLIDGEWFFLELWRSHRKNRNNS